MADPILTAVVVGRPRPQGSMTLARDPRSGREFARYASSTVMHRNYMISVLRDAWAGRAALTGPVAVQAVFLFARPRSHFRTGRFAAELKPGAARWVINAPDSCKLLRLVDDALEISGVLDNDSRVVALRGEKLWADRDETKIEVWEL